MILMGIQNPIIYAEAREFWHANLEISLPEAMNLAISVTKLYQHLLICYYDSVTCPSEL